MYVTEIEKHYFDRKGRQFDPVNEALLQRPYLINDNVIDEINATVYHNEYERYYKVVVDALENKAGCKILSSKYAKSVTAWIYAGDISLEFYESTQEYLRNNYDRKIPSIHLMDVWKYLKATKQLFLQSISAQAITIQLSGEKGHNKRCAISEIRNYGDWQKGYEEGSSLCFEGDKAQKEGNLDKAIELFDKARYCGYIVPYLYECYAKTYRKMHDLQNEISILNEAVEQMKKQGLTNKAIKFENQKRKAENKVQKDSERIVADNM